MNRVLLAVIILFFIGIPTVVAPPPLPSTVNGRITGLDAEGLPNGTPVLLNNTNTGQIFFTVTDAPANPNLKGSYSSNVNATNGDLFTVTSWNATHWGINQDTLTKQKTTIDVVLNNTRIAEANVTIIFPLNNSLIRVSTQTNITARVDWNGYNGTNCFVNLTLSNNTVLTLFSGESDHLYLGNVSIGDTQTIVWNATANATTFTNISVEAYCEENQIFDGSQLQTITNVSVFDDGSPIVTTSSPPNNSNFVNNTQVTFSYIVNDNSSINNCSLVVNDIVNLTNTTIERNITQTFNQSFSVGNYSWKINCTDASPTHNTGISTTLNISVTNESAKPEVSSLSITNPIILTPGTNTTVYCNATVSDATGSDNIISVNATLHHGDVLATDPNDFNNHYTNTSCTNISSTALTKNFMCSFDLTYYANSSTWTCAIEAIDAESNTGINTINTTVQSLIALSITAPTIDYGFLSPGNISNTDENLSIINFGNQPINISVRGFGKTVGDGLSFDCTRGNVSVAAQRYSPIFNTTYTLMSPLASSFTQIANFSINHRNNDTALQLDQQPTHWKTELPYAIAGRCNGTVTVLATASS